MEEKQKYVLTKPFKKGKDGFMRGVLGYHLYHGRGESEIPLFLECR